MATSAGTSAFLSFILSIMTISGLQLGSATLASTKGMTIVGGFISAILFLFVLTFISNVEQVFSRNAQAKWFEVVFALIIAVMAAASVHGVCATTCIIFSSGLLYLTTIVSRKKYVSRK
eukprot:tig00000388_g24801.t1